MSKIKNLTPDIIREMIKEERQKIMEERQKLNSKFLSMGDNKYDPYKKKSAKSGMKEVGPEGYAKTTDYAGAAKKLNEQERVLKRKLKKINEMKKELKVRILRDL